jgi:chitinase
MFSVASAFIVFGIIDNGVMVVSGSAIETALGKTFNLSTMASAGLGNTLSDIVGIVCGRYIEKRLFKGLTKDTENMSPRTVVISETIGITLGCLIGMTPLLFM